MAREDFQEAATLLHDGLASTVWTNTTRVPQSLGCASIYSLSILAPR